MSGALVRAVRRPPGSERTAACADRTVWLLDLDNTLHDGMRSVLPQINRAMTDYVMRHLALDEPQAHALREDYWKRYGATLLGLVRHHGVDAEHFLQETHRLPDLHRQVRRDMRLIHLLRRLPGCKVVLTNAPTTYALRVMTALGIAPLLDGLIAIEQMRFAGALAPKPSRPMLRRLLARLRLSPSRCVLVEDTVENLRSARHCGVRTVWITGHAWRACPVWQRPRARQGGIDVQLRTVVQLVRTPLARRSHEH